MRVLVFVIKKLGAYPIKRYDSLHPLVKTRGFTECNRKKW